MHMLQQYSQFHVTALVREVLYRLHAAQCNYSTLFDWLIQITTIDPYNVIIMGCLVIQNVTCEFSKIGSS